MSANSGYIYYQMFHKKLTNLDRVAAEKATEK